MLFNDDLVDHLNMNVSTGSPGIQGHPGKVYIFAFVTVTSKTLPKNN